MALRTPAVHRTILVVDVANFGDRQIIAEQLVVRDGVYRALREAFGVAGIPWADCDHEDRGDGLLVLAPPNVPKAYFIEGLPNALVEALSTHNGAHPARERIRLRMAIHAGEVTYDDHGVTSPAVNLTFRLVDAPAFRATLKESPGVLAVAASPWFFDEVVRHSPAYRPDSYRPVRIRVKETDTTAWITVLDATPSAGPPAEALVGRDAELSRLTESVRDVVDGTGRAVLIDGEPGIGKTALVRAACAAANECLVLWGAGDELGQALPLLPLLDALRMPGAAGHPRGAAIARLLRGEVPLGGADPVAAASEQIVALVGELCAAAPVVLVVDDLQWADRPTIALWTRLSKSVRRQRLLLVGIARPVPRNAELSALRRAATGCVRVRLGPLPKPVVLDFVTAVTGGKPDEDLIRLADGAAGNPLFLTELLDALHRENALRITEAGVAELVGGGVPESLQAAIGNRLEFVAGHLGEVLRTAALLGVEFSAVELAVVLNRPMTELGCALDEARAAGVLRAVGAHLTFRHPLIRQVLYESLPVAIRTAWHWDAARALAMSGAPVHRVARQLLCAIRRSRVEVRHEWLADWLVSAAPALLAQSPPIAVELLRIVVTDPTAAETPMPALACRLADALFRTGDITEAERIASRTATAVTDPDLMVDLQWTRCQCRVLTGRSAESLTALEHDLASPGIDPRNRARLLVLAARAQFDLGKVDTAIRSASQALTEAEIIQDRWSIAWALHVLIIGSIIRGEVRSTLPLFGQALAVTDGDTTLVDLRMLVQINHTLVLGDLDQYDEAIMAAREVCVLAERTGSLIRLAQAHGALGQLLFGVGRWDDALHEVNAVNDRIKDPGGACCDHGVAAMVSFHRGHPQHGRHHLKLAAPSARRIGDHVISTLVLARSLERECSGAPDEALATLMACLTDQAEEQGTDDLLPDAVRLAVDLADQRTAATLVEQAEIATSRSSVAHRAAAALYCRGLLERDPDRLSLAAASYGESGRPLPRAQALEAAAIAIADSRSVGDARAAFVAANDAYRSLGARWDMNRLRATFRRYGLRP